MCSHHMSKHGANRLMSYHECTECKQRQTMPLTPVTELHSWNNTLCYIPDPFYQKTAAKSKAKGSKQETASASSPEQQDKHSPLTTPTVSTMSTRRTACKTRVQPFAPPRRVKEEEIAPMDQDFVGADSWHDVVANQILRHGNEAVEPAMIGDPHAALEMLLHEALSQSCDTCHQGEVVLHRRSPSMHLLWKCDNPNCPHHWGQLEESVKPAVGVLICPRCQSKEMLQIAPGDEAENEEIQCMDENCNLAAYLFEMPTAYAKIGRFNVNLLSN